MPNLTVTSRCNQTLYFDGKPFVFQKGERVTLPETTAQFFAGKPDISIERGKSVAPASPPPVAPAPPPPAPPPATSEPPPPVGDADPPPPPPPSAPPQPRKK